MDSTELYKAMAELSEQGTPFVLATVIEAVGSTPRKAGAKMVVLGDGRILDTVGGGKVEAQIIEDAREALRQGTSRVVDYELRPTGEHALGMVCGGRVKVFLEVNGPANTLLIVGGGHIALKLCPMAKLLDFRVAVLDSRPEFATAERFPDADTVIVGSPDEVAQLVSIDRGTHIVIVTHTHTHDLAALRAVVGSPAAYIGMIGSRNKVRTLKGQLEEEGVPGEALARVRAPVGLDLGGQTPAEISLSILAQIVAERHGKVSGPGDTAVGALAPAGGAAP
ncbi:MAG: XdhC/CoxI family protein [Thermoleophilia bacterium]